MIKIDDVSQLFELEPMKYWSLPTGMTDVQRQDKLNLIMQNKPYIYSLKTDGNLVRMISTPERFALQTRGRGVNSGDFGEVQDKVVWAEAMKHAFEDTTVLLGEAYLIGGIDKDVGSILRCLPDKAKKRQNTDEKIVRYRIFDCLYYNGLSLLNAPISERITYLDQAVSAIDNPYVEAVDYYNANPASFWNNLEKIFADGGEGVVLYDAAMTPCEGRTSAYKTIKVKQNVSHDIDAFIIGLEPPEREYNGKEEETWEYWYDLKTEQRMPLGNYLSSLIQSGGIIPVSKSFYYNRPGAIVCGVFDTNGKVVQLCKVSNLTEELQEALKQNYPAYHMCPVSLSAMMVSQTREKNGLLSYSLRHPKLIAVRKGDIDIKDCTLEKAIN